MRTKIVATIGPASAAADKVHALAEIGVDVVRLNFAHGNHETHRQVIEWVREAAVTVGKPLAVLADLAGPKIRIGSIPEPIDLRDRSLVVLAPEAIAAGDEIPTTYAGLAGDVQPGSRVLLDDGIMELRVAEVRHPRVMCRVARGGLLRSNKGINLPGIRVSAPALTEKDIADLDFALGIGVDYVGLSFVQRPDDIRDLRSRISSDALIVAKIEKDTALENIEPILALTDAVMVARGDLGVELPFEQVPIAQKRIIQLANLYGRPVITATQMLESMIEYPRPTRAEASDVANAIFDGTDAVMLSGETAMGRFPLLAVEAMARIAGEIERTADFAEGPKYDMPMLQRLRIGATPTEHAIAAATVEAVRLLGAPAVVTFTRTGSTSRLVSSYRPPVPILGVTDRETTWRQLALVWGVRPVMCEAEVNYDNMLAAAREYLLANRLAEAGQRIVVTAGVPFHVRGTTNLLRVEEL
ncbi:MAG TPA: pyruvate kinase [Longimicrobiales bacterium]|nr:pyruvate kinase [Longimicrobiales bacterium]